jgi:D-arabinose 1-dehydrogenase-like Zn-dependent alcohol dehydrogenase
MSTFKAAVLTSSNQPLEILELITPNKLGEGQVLIKMLKASLCGSQLGEISAVKGVDKYLPHVLGHEAVAEIIEVGRNVKHLQIGDKVIAHWMKNPQSDGEQISYLTISGESINSGPVAIFAELAIVSQNRLTKITSNLDESILAIIGCGFLTSYGVIKRDLKITPQSKGSLLILGFGGIGQITFTLASKLSNLEITVLDNNELNLVKAKKMGVKAICSSLNQLKDGNFEFIIDTTGNTKIIENGYQLLAKPGILCLVGVTPVDEKIEIDPMPLHYGRQIIGSFGGQAVPGVDIPEILTLIEKDVNWFRGVIGESYPLSQINEAVELLKSGKNSGRVLINFSM